jgi:hypothetical protein
MKKIAMMVALFVATIATGNSALACDACGKNDPKVELRNTMQKLWADHMMWTYTTVDAFFNNADGLSSQLGRLLQNQKDIGAAVVPFYGQAGGDALAKLLKEHIEGAVPVLTVAKNGDSEGVKVALDAWYKNAEEIADFLSAANPKAWK